MMCKVGAVVLGKPVAVRVGSGKRVGQERQGCVNSMERKQNDGTYWFAEYDRTMPSVGWGARRTLSDRARSTFE